VTQKLERNPSVLLTGPETTPLGPGE
jgi:hypothetical protein